ncbi:MAG TPA: M1 family metallopeptidase [Chitinophagaceae bacterium]|jgi:aminopeptidase N|nr:M1 family metallopeptidase [Chitinophagaceae bacterium]
MKFTSKFLISIFLFFTTFNAGAQILGNAHKFTRYDTLRGSVTKERMWWDVTCYNITVKPDFENKTIEGEVNVSFKVLNPDNLMQIDMQVPMEVKSVSWNGGRLPFKRDSNVYLIRFSEMLKKGSDQRLTISFSGKPKEAHRPPWDGGWIWATDKKGNPWVSVACQGLGASAWFPCKDHQSDEPDSASLTMVVPDSLTGVANGRLRSKIANTNGTTAYTWSVNNPINSYNLIPYIGKYVNWSDTYSGEKGNLDCSYWVLQDHLDSAKAQFKQVSLMLKCFEHWFGPYPFYEDGYKLVESPHLGMEHQSAIGYGNRFRNGYLGTDLSGTGWGLKWDFIIVHESGHEWFGNNITSKDLGDMWIHESFTNYAETLFTETQFGKEAGQSYLIGTRIRIENKAPVIGPYQVNSEGFGGTDMYYKGGNMLHIIRQIINNDDIFRKVLRGLNQTFYHKTVNAKQVEDYISRESGMDFSKVFDQYLRNTQVPVLEYRTDNSKFYYRWSDCVPGFNMPVKISYGKEHLLRPTQSWQSIPLSAGEEPKVDRNFYVLSRKV